MCETKTVLPVRSTFCKTDMQLFYAGFRSERKEKSNSWVASQGVAQNHKKSNALTTLTIFQTSVKRSPEARS